MGRRATALDADNRDLHAEIARAQQEKQLMQEEVALLRKLLTERTNQLRDEQLAGQTTTKQMEAIQASTRRGGGAAITANNSQLAPLQMINITGFEVRQDGDVIRIEVPADRLFHARTAELLPTAAYVLDQLADPLARQYPQQKIGIEAHTDNSPSGTTDHMELANAQSLAVYRILAQQKRLSTDQLFVVSHEPISRASPTPLQTAGQATAALSW